MVSFKCRECSFATERSYNLRRHMKNKHGVAKNTVVPTKSSVVTSQVEYGLAKRPRIQEPEDGLYTKERCEENMDTSYGPSQLGDGLPRRQPRADPEDGLYTKEEYEENYEYFTSEVPNYEFRHFRSEIHAPVHSHHCWPIQFGKVNVLYAPNT